MTEHLTMNTVVHAAFRRTLQRFDDALTSFPDGSQRRADQLARAWDFFEHELHQHHGHEEELFWPALQQTDADLSALAELDGEHEAMRAALADATRSMADLQASPTARQAGTTRTAVGRLSSVLLHHLDHEERDLEPISAAYQDAPSMKEALRQVKRKSTKSLGGFVEWVQDGADESDRAALREEIPPPVVFLFGRIGGRRYRREIAPTWREG